MKSLLFLSTILMASSAAAIAGSDDSFLLKGATIHTMAGPDIANGSILVTNGKITGIGDNLAAPAGTRVIDATGMQVYPGMIDSATDVGLTEIGAVRESGDVNEIGKFNPQLSTWMDINPSSEHIPVTRANGITTTLAMPEGELVTGRASLIHLNGWTTEEMVFTKSAALHVIWPTIKTRTFRFPDGAANKPYEDAKKDYDKEVRELNGFFEDSRRYAQAKAAHEPGFQPDLKFEAMIPVLEGQTPVLISASREREIKAAIEFADKQKIKMILGGGVEAWKVTALLKSHNIPVVLRPTLSLPEEEDEPYDRPFDTPGELQKAGILFSFASYESEFSRNLPYQAAAAVPFGLPHDAAMAAVTINAARIYGVDKMIGSIEEGKIADLMVTDGDPLLTPTQVKKLFIAGKEVDLDNKHLRLYKKYETRP
jgi:imidazolonepropionase-like amidohydrolase